MLFVGTTLDAEEKGWLLFLVRLEEKGRLLVCSNLRGEAKTYDGSHIRLKPMTLPDGRLTPLKLPTTSLTRLLVWSKVPFRFSAIRPLPSSCRTGAALYARAPSPPLALQLFNGKRTDNFDIIQILSTSRTNGAAVSDAGFKDGEERSWGFGERHRLVECAELRWYRCSVLARGQRIFARGQVIVPRGPRRQESGQSKTPEIWSVAERRP